MEIQLKSFFVKCHDEILIRLKEKSVIWHMIFCVIMLVCWLPYYLSFYPGIVRNDEIVCLKQVLGEYSYSNHHPIVFTMFLKVVYKIVSGLGGDMNVVVAMATLGQMIFFAITLNSCLVFLWKRSNSIWINYGTTLFFIISPVIAKFAITLGKDTFFAGWFIMYTLVLYRIYKENWLKENRFSGVCFVAVSVMTAIARSNGLYMIIAMCFLSSICWRKIGWRLWICNLMTVLSVFFIKGPVFEHFQVAEPAVAEAFTVPLQQVGYVLSENREFNQADMEYLNQILPIEDWKTSYTPEISDTLKFHQNFNTFYLNDTSTEFLKVWFRGLLPNFSYYVKAYLEQIRGYWDILQISDMGSWEVTDNQYGIEQRDLWEESFGFSIKRICILGVQAMRKLPILNILTNEPLLILFWIGSFLYILRKKNGLVVTILPGIILWGTLLLAAPASLQFRYLLSNHLLMPYVLFIVVMNKKEKRKA